MGKDSSLDIYNSITKKPMFGKAEPITVKDIENLLETMKAELIISSNSALLDASYNECINYYLKQGITKFSVNLNNYFIKKPSKRNVLTSFDAWNFPILLSDYMNGSLSANQIEELLPYFGKNSQQEKNVLNNSLKPFVTIDNLIVELRRKMYTGTPENSPENINDSKDSSFVNTESVAQEHADKVKALMPEAEEEKKKITEKAESEARKIVEQAKSDAKKIVEDARIQGESEKKEMLDKAQEQANNIVLNASDNANKRIAEANKRISELSADKRFSEYAAEHNNTEQCFSSVREALVKANESIKLLEDAFHESITKKAYTQLIELYNLISDTKDSTFSLAAQTNSRSLENAAYNMNVFLDMLVEYLADYGIKTITSSQGDAFSPKHHTLGKTNVQFDPRNAHISRSLRNGFIWGEQVLQKEQVEIEGDNYVFGD